MKKTVDINLDDEIALLYEEMIENDSFYKQAKDHYDKLMNSRSAGTLKFISDQTSNILSIKKNKIDIIKELIGVKKTKADLQIKEYNLNKDSNGDDGNIKELASAIYDVLKGNKKDVTIGGLLNKSKEIENDDDTDDKLNERLAEIKRKREEEEEKKKNKFKIVTDEQGNLYPVNDEYELLEDVVVPDLKIEFGYEHGERVAKDQFGNLIEIIQFEEE